MKKLVLAFGTFDIIHYGHLKYLEEAKRYGNKLTVIVARDKSVELLKGRKPVFDEQTRLRVVRSLKPVDAAFLGDRLSKASDRYNIIRKYRPNAVVIGYDQVKSTGDLKRWIKKEGLRTKVIKLRMGVDTDIFKSSKIRKRLL